MKLIDLFLLSNKVRCIFREESWRVRKIAYNILLSSSKFYLHSLPVWQRMWAHLMPISLVLIQTVKHNPMQSK